MLLPATELRYGGFLDRNCFVMIDSQQPRTGPSTYRVCVVIPCFRCRESISEVIARIGPRIERIFVVDDRCPDQTGDFVRSNVTDSRVCVLQNEVNLGVGGAVITGYRAALAEGFDVAVKLDGDGQMAPELIESLIEPILGGEADYTKGNRFFRLESLESMPPVRLFGNAVLSFISKLSSGYWYVMDPTNGFTAIHRAALELIPLEKVAERYFFESDMLFRLNTVRAVVRDVPIDAYYGDEQSHLSVTSTAIAFPRLYFVRLCKRIFYTYCLRDFNFCSLELVFGAIFFTFGVCFGAVHWWMSISSGITASTGTVMVAALPIILGFQLLLSAIGFDMGNSPKAPLQRLYSVVNKLRRGKPGAEIQKNTL